jgi:hypothetical protein
MESDSTDDHMVAVTAKVPRDVRSEIDALAANDEPRSAVMRRLIRDGIKRKENSMRIRIVSILVFLGVAGFPTLLAYNGSIQSAVAFLLLIGALDFIQSLRGGRTFIRM